MGAINTDATATAAAADKPSPPASGGAGAVPAHDGDGGGLFGMVLARLAGAENKDQLQETGPASAEASSPALLAALVVPLPAQNPDNPPAGAAASPAADGQADGAADAVAAPAVVHATAQAAGAPVAAAVSQDHPVSASIATAALVPPAVAAAATMTETLPGHAAAPRAGKTPSTAVALPQEVPAPAGKEPRPGPSEAAAEARPAIPQAKTEATGTAVVAVTVVAPERAAAPRTDLPRVAEALDDDTAVPAPIPSRAVASSGTLADDPRTMHGAAAATFATRPPAGTKAAAPLAAPGKSIESPRAAPAPPGRVSLEQTGSNAGGSPGTIAVAAEEEERRTTGADRPHGEPSPPAGPAFAPAGGERLAAEFLPSPAPAGHGPEVVLPAPKSLQPVHDVAPPPAGPQRETIQIQLPPSEVGRVTMQVSVQARQVHAAVTVEHHGLGELLAAGQGSLDDAMKRNGLHMEEFRVDTFEAPADRGGAWPSGHEPSGFRERNDAAPIRNTETGAAGAATAPPAEDAAEGASLQRINLFV